METLPIPKYERDQTVKKCATVSVSARTKGNELFRGKNHSPEIHKDILSLYTKSIAYAPQDTEELAYAYGNRSVLALHLNKYHHCMTDVDRAVAITKSDSLKAKLLERRDRCLKAIDEAHCRAMNLEEEKFDNLLDEDREDKVRVFNDINEQNVNPLPVPGFVASKECPSASEALTVKCNRKFGRHLVANREIRTGEFLVVEKAYGLCAFPEQQYMVCANCLNYTWVGIPCDECSTVIYCRDECKRSAWDRCHKVECCKVSAILRLINTKASDCSTAKTMLTLAVQTMIRGVKEYGIQGLLKEIESVNNCTGIKIYILSFIL